MKDIKRSNFFLPEEKEYLLWVFLGLFTIFLIQALIYPKFKRIETYNILTQNYRKELEEMNNKISEVMTNKTELKNIESFLNEKLSYRGNIISLINSRVVQQMPSSFKIIKLSSEKYIGTAETQLLPVSIEFTSNKNDLSVLFNKLNKLPLPMEIVELKIDGLSPQDISVKIQMIFEKRNLK